MEPKNYTCHILALLGSTKKDSVNRKILKIIQARYNHTIHLEIVDTLDQLPHFNPDLDGEVVPPFIKAFRSKINQADGLLISTPEYVFSIPGVLKNALEWLVSTVILSEKPVAAITAGASGEKAMEQLKLILKTLMANMKDEHFLVISGANGKFDHAGNLTDPETGEKINGLFSSFLMEVNSVLPKNKN